MGHLQGPGRAELSGTCAWQDVPAHQGGRAVTAGHPQAVQGDASPTCTALEA